MKKRIYFNLLFVFLLISCAYIIYDINFAPSRAKLKLEDLSLIELSNLSIKNDIEYSNNFYFKYYL